MPDVCSSKMKGFVAMAIASPGHRSFTTMSRRMSNRVPPWLRTVLEDKSRPKKLYAWSLGNVQSSPPHRESPTVDLDRRIFILGLGNIGRLYASFLAKLPSPPPITLVVHRKTLLTQWAEGEGIELTCGGVVDKNKGFNIEWWTEDRPEQGPVREVADGKRIQNLLITTKAATALPEADRLRSYLDETSTVAFAQNGMAKLWPPHGQTYVAHRYSNGKVPSFVSCITTHGVTSLGPYRSVHASPANAVVGPVLLNAKMHERTSYLLDCITEAPLLEASRVTRSELWTLQLEKLVVNSIINPLTAVLRCKNGVLFEDGDGPIMRIMDKLLAETSQVLQTLIRHESSAEVLTEPAERGEGDLATKQRELMVRFSKPRLRSMLHRVGALVAANTSSMLQDIQAGKELEIRDFNGWIADMAAYLDQGLEVKCHEALIDLVENREELSSQQLSGLLLGDRATEKI